MSVKGSSPRPRPYARPLTLRHFVVEGYLLGGRRLVGRKHPRRQLPPHGRAAYVREILPPERLDKLVEARGRVDVEAAEEDGAVLSSCVREVMVT